MSIVNRKDECAEAFASAGFGVGDVAFSSVLGLAYEVERQLELCRANPATPLQESMRVCGIDVDYGASGDISGFSILVSGYYFQSRAAIEISDVDGAFVGSWCDSKNVEPFYRAFMIWFQQMESVRESVLDVLADNALSRVPSGKER